MTSRINLKWAAETACVQNDRVVMLILALPIRLKGTEHCERLESRVNLSLTPQSSLIPLSVLISDSVSTFTFQTVYPHTGAPGLAIKMKRSCQSL